LQQYLVDSNFRQFPVDPVVLSFDETVLSAHWDDPQGINLRVVKAGDWQLDFLETL
jgi:hypothetical protein